MNRRLLSTGLLSTLALPASLAAGEPLDPGAVSLGPGPGPAPMSSSGWRFELVPYAWAPTTDGTVGALGRTESVKLDASDAIENLDIAGSLAFVARHDRWGLVLDGFYSRISTDVPLGGLLFKKVDVTATSAFANFGISYNLWNNERTFIDLTAGGRVTYIKNELRFQENLAPRAIESDDDNTWLDGTVGFRGRYYFTDRLWAGYFGDIGFGSSDLTWQLAGVLGFKFTDWLDGRIGYRYLSTDYSSGGLTYDVEQYGFMVGLGMTW